jgi:hypothetical protein
MGKHIGRRMRIKRVVWGGLVACTLFIAAVTFADTVTGTGGAAFQSWLAANLNQNGNPYWDNTSMDGENRNVGFYLTDAPTAPLVDAPGALPFWGNAFNSGTDTGGAADPSFFFQRTAPSSAAILKLEVAGKSNINEFGWYDTNSPAVLNPLFLSSATALVTNTFSPTLAYGFYLKSGADTYYTQSSLNSNAGDTTRQHFAIFRESAATGAEIYWIGIEDLTAAALGNNESGVGDYQDMLIRISATAIPEPSTAMLIVTGTLLMLGLRHRRR